MLAYVKKDIRYLGKRLLPKYHISYRLHLIDELKFHNSSSIAYCSGVFMNIFLLKKLELLYKTQLQYERGMEKNEGCWFQALYITNNMRLRDE